MTYIKEIELRNYRVFADASIRFPRKKGKNICLIRGINGVGKTTILDAVSWCLFGTESNEHGLRPPMCNARVLERANEGQDVETAVKVTVETNDGECQVVRTAVTVMKNGQAECESEKGVGLKLHPIIPRVSFIKGENLDVIARSLEFPMCASLAASETRRLGFWIIVGVRNMFRVDFPVFFDSPGGCFDLYHRGKFAKEIIGTLTNTQVILLENDAGMSDQLKSHIASAHRISYNKNTGSSSCEPKEMEAG